MRRRTKPIQTANPSSSSYLSLDISTYTELEFGKDIIKPGDKIKIKNARGYFIFLKWAHNSHLDVTWVDCMNPETGEFRSFYIDSLKGVYRAKKSIRKKLV